MLYYMWCVKLHQPEDVFFRSTLGKVVTMIDMWGDEQKAIAHAANGGRPQQPQKTAHSIREALGGLV